MAKAPANSAARRVARRSARTLRTVLLTCTLRSTTPSSPSPTVKATLCPGLRRVVRVSRARVSPLPSLPRWLLKWQVAPLKNKGIKNLDVEIKGPGPVASLPFAHWQRWHPYQFDLDVTPVPHNGCRPQKRRRI